MAQTVVSRLDNAPLHVLYLQSKEDPLVIINIDIGGRVDVEHDEKLKSLIRKKFTFKNDNTRKKLVG